MKLTPQALELLKVAQDYRADQCQALFASAASRSRTLLKQAQRAARSELCAKLSQERERLAAEFAASEAKLVTQRRLREQRRVAGVLRRAWPGLVQALQERWATPSGRTAWVVQQLATARQPFPPEGWVIQHPANWPATELEQANQWLRAHGVADARFEHDPRLAAGIRIVCGLNLLDASQDGLLADRTQIEGRLLHHLARLP